MNPELRQTFNTISRNFESANEAAQVNFYDFTSHYIDPCLASIKGCLSDCTASCFPSSDDHLRRARGRSRGHAEFGFDFYDDWEEEEANANHASRWSNDELEGLLAGRDQPRAQRAMSYGARGRLNDLDSDPTVIPKSSYIGFLDRLPFKFGARGLRYKPSSAGLQENPGGLRIRDVEVEPLIEENEHDDQIANGRHKGHTRTRSHTGASQSTATSRSARSDLIMSDEEDDAVPIDDEFASAMLSRRTTSSGGADDTVATKSTSGKRPILSRISTRTTSSKSLHINKSRRSSSRKSLRPLSPETTVTDRNVEPPTMLDLRLQEAKLEEQEELEIVMKREAAINLARENGLLTEDAKSVEAVDVTESQQAEDPIPLSDGHDKMSSPVSPVATNAIDTEPFPDVSVTDKDSESAAKPP